MANDKIMEAIARIEHKSDLTLHLLLSTVGLRGSSLKEVADPTHTCPVCKQPVTYQIDINDSVVVRKCSCGTGKIPVDLKSFAPPVLPAKRTNNGGRDDEQEDRDDSDRGSRGSKRR